MTETDVPAAGLLPERRPQPSSVDRALSSLAFIGPRLGRARATARSARTKILVAYVVILAFSAGLAVGLLREALLLRNAEGVRATLEHQVQELERSVLGIDPATGAPFASVEAVFDDFLRTRLPGEDQAILTYVDGRLYRSAVSRYPLDTLPARTLAGWEARSVADPGDARSSRGRFESPLGQGYFRLSRLHIGEQTGTFVVASVPADELTDIGQLHAFAVAAAIGALIVGTSAAWVITGRVLAPVRDLTETADAISRSDLTRRIAAQGSGEAADMARSFNAMLDRLEAVLRSQRQFVQDASHEFRAPLTIAQGHLELLSEDPTERAATKALVIDELKRMARIVSDLQVLADIEHPDFVRPEPIDLVPFTHELLAKARALAPRRWKLEEAADGVLQADRWGLTEAVMNLADNAVRHTDPEDTIAIGTTIDGDSVRIRVRDTGQGIAVTDQARVFQRFERGSGADRRYRGSGLGLAIVKAISTAHGGRVELESRVGLGSTFTVIIPMRRSGKS